MDSKKKILIIDDEKSIVLSLKVMLNETFQDINILSAYNGTDGLEIIQKELPDIVISDTVMSGMNGHQLCQKIKSDHEFESIYFIMLIPQSDAESRIKALESGADDILQKPLQADEVLTRMYLAFRSAENLKRVSEVNNLLHDLADELENSLKEFVQMSIKFQSARVPSAANDLQRIAKSSLWIASQLDMFESDDIREIETAAMLCYAGKMFFPDEMLRMQVLINGQPSNTMVYQIPVFAKDIVGTVQRFKDVSEILYHVYENFDGSGFPERLSKWKIPLASRILRVAIDYEEMRYHSKLSPSEIVTFLRKESNRLYDHRVVTLLEQYLALIGEAALNYKENALNLSDLEEGMVLSRDIYTNSGLKLMTSGGILKASIIEKLIAHNSSDPILGSVFIREK